MTGNSPRSGKIDALAGTDAHDKHGHSVKERALEEAKRFFIIFLYLYVFLALFTLHESIILARNGINFTGYGFAVVNALVLAKVMLVAQDLRLGHRLDDKPLIYPILFKSLVFAIVFIGFHVIEDVLVGLWHGKSVVDSVPTFGGGGLEGVLAVGVIMAVALIPFFAFSEIARGLGTEALRTVMFKRGLKDVIIEFRLRS